MKLTKFFKTVVISICLAASFVTAGLALTGCGGNNENPADKKPNKTDEIKQAVSAVVDFLETVRDGGNYYAVSEFSDGSIYTYYTADGKIKVEYNDEVFYGVKFGNSLYKISQAEDMNWHKTNDTTDLSEPVRRINNLIDGVNKTSKASLWSDYDSETKTLTATYPDGTATIKLDAGEYIETLITNTGTTKYIIKYVGGVAITLPENIIDDTQY